MQKITFYMLFYTPGGAGQVVFRLEGETHNRSTNPLSPNDFAALGILLAQKNLAFDPVKGSFASTDTNDEITTDSHIA